MTQRGTLVPAETALIDCWIVMAEGNHLADDRMKVFVGPAVDTVRLGDLRVQEDCVLIVQNGQIQSRDSSQNLVQLKLDLDLNEDDIYHLQEGEFLMPGLVDTHFHAPQYPVIGTKMDLSLLSWLDKYIFPTEAKYADLKFADEVFSEVIKTTLRNGTTTAVYFSTIHLEASKLLCDKAESLGQRAYIGKVNMDASKVNYYKETTEESMRNTEDFITSVLQKQNPLIVPVVTPRFAPSCTMQMMTFLGSLAKKYDIPVQSHISETKEEVALVQRLFPTCKNYTDVYNQSGLLTNKTVMAHGIFLTGEELRIFKEKGSGVAHCPNSNISIQSGLCDVRSIINNEVKLSLGTDVAAGYSPSILDSMRYSIQTSKIIALNTPDHKPITYKEALYLATLGGCEVLGTSEKLGSLSSGKQFDALLVNTKASNPLFIGQEYTIEVMTEILKKFTFKEIV